MLVTGLVNVQFSPNVLLCLYEIHIACEKFFIGLFSSVPQERELLSKMPMVFVRVATERLIPEQGNYNSAGISSLIGDRCRKPGAGCQQILLGGQQAEINRQQT